MKKLLSIAALAGLAWVAYQRYVQDRNERELWAEVTDTLD